jgi:predicted nucleotidyltransferase
MQLPETWREAIEQWAARTASVREVWLFGSRAKGTAEPDSDVDIAIRLMPPTKGTDWGHFYRFGDEWQSELKAAISRHVSLVLLPTAQDIGPRILLWTRE